MHEKRRENEMKQEEWREKLGEWRETVKSSDAVGMKRAMKQQRNG